MTHAIFDANQMVRFQLTRGAVELASGSPLCLVPASALRELCEQAPRPIVQGFGRSMGVELGRRVVARVGSVDKVRGSTIETIVTQVAGECAIAGLGALRTERWGRALLVIVDGGLVPSAFLGAIVEGLLEQSSGKTLAVTLLHEDKASARFLVSSPQTKARAEDWLQGGASWSDVVTRLQTSRGAS